MKESCCCFDMKELGVFEDFKSGDGRLVSFIEHNQQHNYIQFMNWKNYKHSKAGIMCKFQGQPHILNVILCDWKLFL